MNTQSLDPPNPNLPIQQSRVRQRPGVARRLRSSPAALAVVMLGCAFLASGGAAAAAPSAVAAAATAPPASGKAAETAGESASLESAATKAGDMGRKVAISLIGLALAVAAVVLAFRRDFRKVAGVLVIGLVAVLLATPVGLSVLQDTVKTLFGSA